MKFEVGKIYIDSKSCHLILCTEYSITESSFYYIEDKIIKKFPFFEFYKIHEWKSDTNLFKDYLFYFTSSCLYKDKFYTKIVEANGGRNKSYVTSNTNFIVINDKTDITNITKIHKETIKINKILFLQEVDFWKCTIKQKVKNVLFKRKYNVY